MIHDSISFNVGVRQDPPKKTSEQLQCSLDLGGLGWLNHEGGGRSGMGSHSDFRFFSLWKEAAEGWLFQEIRTTDGLNGK